MIRARVAVHPESDEGLEASRSMEDELRLTSPVVRVAKTSGRSEPGQVTRRGVDVVERGTGVVGCTEHDMRERGAGTRELDRPPQH